MTAATATITHQKTFLFIDDDPLNNMICRMTIEMILGKVPSESFTNPQEGLDYLKTGFLEKDQSTRSVLLLDINMPLMSGWEFLDRFDDLPSGTKDRIQIYILSSSVDRRDKERSYANKNVKDFLVKPLTMETVMQMFQG